MMLEGYLKFVRRFLPSPFSIAIILSIVTLVAVLFYSVLFQKTANTSEVIGWWRDGLFNGPLIVFAVQMMLMLVLGHVLALSPFFSKLIQGITKHCTNSARAALVVAASTLLVGLFNWGLGLIFGAVLARKIGEHAKQNQLKINYPLIAAAGYSALMIWHGGFSGSALIKVAESGHLATLVPDLKDSLPEKITLAQSMFSGLNIITNSLILLLVPAALYFVGKASQDSIPNISLFDSNSQNLSIEKIVGAEHLDHGIWLSKIVGLSITAYCLWMMFSEFSSPLDFFTPNNINLLLLGLAIASHKNVNAFLQALDEAIVGAAGILIQFPLYFGIMGLMRESGLVKEISQWFVSISNESTFPLFTYLSAGLVNIFVPSGGGQWAIQGPIIVQSSTQLGVPLEKSILALAYGDQITNMLQPFWALPLLGITKLNARDILPYTLVMFTVGFVVYAFGLMMF